jgi:hypothetical protein
MPKASLDVLITAYQAEIEWLLAQAEEFESGLRKVTGKVGGQELDISSAFAAEYRHKAGNMKAIMEAYERLHAIAAYACE